MLSTLHIENIAVIEAVDIDFAPGFNVLTGETGAGKSIVIDAISAILGERTYRDVIRTGASKAFVSAVFSDVPQLAWFAENHIPYEPELLIQRELTADGRNVCRINGQPVSVSLLRRLGTQLINIHGQHDSQQLFDEENHLRYLDLFARNEAEQAAYRTVYDELTQVRREIERLSIDEGEKLRRTEMLRHQIGEIDRAKLQSGEDEALEARRKLLQNAEKFSQSLLTALNCLYGGDDADGASGLISEAEYALRRIAGFDPRIERLHAGVNELGETTQALCEELIDLKDETTFSPEELDALEARLDTIHRLRRKYGATCEDILAFRDRARLELDEIRFSDDRLLELRAQEQKLEKKTADAAHILRKSRQTAAAGLRERILTELSQLDMPNIQFECRFTEIPFAPDGTDQIAFLMSANAGEALRPMSKVASGGELARIMLALKNVLAERDSVATLIFDEVDAGVSGRAAQKVAAKLRSVADAKQILCVTHLPQIAAQADRHLLIAKSERGGRTYTDVTPLDRAGRINELARIIGGEHITETTRKSAAEMLRDGIK